MIEGEKQFIAEASQNRHEALKDLPYDEAVKSVEFQELLQREPETHFKYLWYLREKALRAVTLVEAADLVARIEVFNISEPKLLGVSQSEITARQLEAVMKGRTLRASGKPLNAQLILYVVDSLRRGSLRSVFDMIGRYREEHNIRSPIPPYDVLRRAANYMGLKFDASSSTHDDIEQIASGLTKLSLEEIGTFVNLLEVESRTGFERYRVLRERYASVWKGGSYYEIGGSVGLNALDVMRTYGFAVAKSADIMSKEQADKLKEFQFMGGAKRGKKFLITDPVVGDIDKQIQRVWNFDTIKQSISTLVQPSDPGPRVVGLHTVLCHLIPLPRIIENAMRAVAEDGFIWITGGHGGRPRILDGIVLKLKGTKVNQIDLLFVGGEKSDISVRMEDDKGFIHYALEVQKLQKK